MKSQGACVAAVLMVFAGFAHGQTPSSKSGPAAATAWEADWKRTLEAANREGKLNLNMHIEEGQAAIPKAFMARYPGIKVEHTMENIATFAPKVITEHRNGKFLWDVAMVPTSNAVTVMTPAGVFQDLMPLVIVPDAKDPAKWHGGFDMWGHNVSDIKKVFIHGVFTQGGFSVNRDHISKAELSNLDQLLDPKWRGRIVIDEPNAPRRGSLALLPMLLAKGPDFVRQLLTVQKPVFTTNPRLMMEWYSTGRYPIVIPERSDLLATFQKEGVIKSSEAHPPFYLSAWGLAAYNKAPNQNAAKVFVNWFLSREGQEVYARSRGEDGGVSRRVDVKSYDPERTPDWSQLRNYLSPNQEKDAPLIRQVLDIYKTTRQ